MTVFLDADCVITRLISIKLINPIPWKRHNPAAKIYHAEFDHIPTNGKIFFEVHIDNGKYKVSAFYIHILERIHDLDLSAIINACIL